jgi:hypothetical protein
MPPTDRGNPGLSSGPARYPGTFLLAFREALAAVSWQARRWRGDAVECLDAEGQEQVIGLENLYRRVRGIERTGWPELIGECLARVRDAEKLGLTEVKLADIADRLLVRFGPAFAGHSNPIKVWWRPVEGTDLGVSLVIDQADTMTYVTEEMIVGAGRPGDEWVERALANLRGRTPADCLELVHEDSGLMVCSVGDAYDSSRALLLEGLLPDAAPAGLLMAIPSRDELLVLPVTLKAMAHIHVLKLLAVKNFKQAPYPITDTLYWVRSGAWRPFPVEIRKEEVAMRPPAEFIEILNQLAPPDRASAGQEDSTDDEEPIREEQ